MNTQKQTGMQAQTTEQKCDLMAAAEKIDAIAQTGIQADLSGFCRAIAVAQAIDQLRKMMTREVMTPIMALQGSPLGFRTDKIYSENEVKECVISALLKGVQITGNQLNIISGRDYITKEGFSYLLSKIEGLRYTIDFGIAQNGEKGAIVKPKIAWRIGDGEERVKELQLAIRVNAGMGHDAIIGKAERKAKCWLYNEITNNTYASADEDDFQAAPAPRNVTPPKNPLQSMQAQAAAQPAPEPAPRQDPEADELPMEFGGEPAVDPNLKTLENALRANGIQKSRFFDYIRDRGIPYNGGESWDGSDGREPFFTPEQTAQLVKNWDDIAAFFNII